MRYHICMHSYTAGNGTNYFKAICVQSNELSNVWQKWRFRYVSFMVTPCQNNCSTGLEGNREDECKLETQFVRLQWIYNIIALVHE